MPTIDQLSPATSASDSDEFIISQAGIVRKITRAQILNGVQAQISVPAGALLGGIGAEGGVPQAITVGHNLSFNGSTLSASAVPFAINALPAGAVPASGDLVAFSQAGTNVSVTYSQLLSGLPNVSNVDLSQGLITPAGATTTQTLSSLAASLLPVTGGTMTGNLFLSKQATIPAHAVNKAYLDQQIGLLVRTAGGSLSGTLTLAGSPQHSLEAATKGYVDTVSLSALSVAGGSLSGALLLSADPSTPQQAATKHYVDLKVSKTGDTLSGALILAGSPVAALQAATKNYVDSQSANALPRSGGTLTGSLLLAADPVSSAQAATKQYVDQRILRSGDTLVGPLSLSGDPVIGAHAANKNYIDAKISTVVSRSGSSLSGALFLSSDPTLPLQTATKQYVDLRVARTGDTLTGSLVLAGNPKGPLDAASKQYVDGQISTLVTRAGGTFIGPVGLMGDPVAPLQAATKQYADGRVSRSGDTLTGALILASDPTSAAQAATKLYVDNQITAALPRTGGTLSGAISLSADPVSPLQAATKHYVDFQVATALPISGGSLIGPLSLASQPTSLSHATTKQYVDSHVATSLSQGGGTLTGMLTLASAPLLPLQAATKSYVDANPDARGIINVTLPPYNAKLNGTSDDTPAFKAAYIAAAPGSVIYVPNGVTVIQQPGSWGIALTKRVKWIVDGTVLADGTPLAAAIPTGGAPSSFALPGFVFGHTPSGLATSQGGSQTSDFSVNQSSYIVNHSGGTHGAVITNVRSDTIIYSSPDNYVWGGLDRLLWVGTQTPNAATPAQHVGRYIQTIRQAAGTSANGQLLPQPQLWSACLEYRDTTGLPSSAANASLTVEMDWIGNGQDDANNRTIQSLVVSQHNASGAPVEVGTIIGVYLAGGSSGSAKTVFGVGIPFSNAVLDTTYAQQINNAPVIKMSAGQAIAFESTNSNRLWFDGATNVLRWNQGTLSFPVGKGISVGWVNVLNSSATLPNYISGNMILLVGATPYTITLPSAHTVAAGTGYTFSVTGNGAVTLATTNNDSIDSGPITLHVNDRYHIVSDGSTSWHEVFRTNAVSPRFTGPITLPSYGVAALPGGFLAGAKAYATDGRKPNEVAGSGTGVEVFFDGQRWISSCSGVAVAA